MIGAGYLPHRVEATDNLVVLKSEFGSGYAMVGTHPRIVSEGVEFTEEVQYIRQSGIITNAKQYNNRIVLTEVHRISGKDFMEAEVFGIEPPRRCSECRGCQKCSFRGQQHTERETLEYKIIVAGLKYNSLNECIDVAYA